MKIRQAFLFILVTCIFIPCETYSQRYQNKQFTLFNYQLEFSKEFREEIKLLDSYLETVKTPQMNTKDKLTAVTIHHIYYSLKEKLESDIQLYILPVNSFLDKIKYNEYEYPQIAIREALRRGDSKYYIKLKVLIESVTEEEREKNPDLFENMDDMVIVPKVNFEIDIYNKDGMIAVDHWTGTATATTPIRIDKNLFKGYDPKNRGEETDFQGSSNLASITNQAILKVVESVY